LGGPARYSPCAEEVAHVGGDRRRIEERVSVHRCPAGLYEVRVGGAGVVRAGVVMGRRRVGRAVLAQPDDDAALRVAQRDALLQHDGAARRVGGCDAAEHARGHAAQRRLPLDDGSERATPVTEHDLALVGVDDVEVAADGALEADVEVGDLLGRQPAGDAVAVR
jgi:hypothetical protein